MKLLRSLSPPNAAAGILAIALLPIAGTTRLAPASEPPVFAITGARVVPVSGPPIEKGTVVIRKGIIEAVGSGIAVPGDARVIDGTGLTVYPGLIDALSDIGLEEAQQAATPRGGGTPPVQPQAQAQPSQTPEERQGVTPWRLALELFNPAHRKIESARAAGITTAVIAPRRGIFAGQSMLVNLGGSDTGEMVVRSPIAAHVNITGAARFGTGFPSSPMGVLSLVKQTLLDTQQYETAWRIYNGNPGTTRPRHSRALEALQPVAKQQLPVVLNGDSPADIGRALDLADAFKLQIMISGALHAREAASGLAQRGIPVLLSVKYPEPQRDGDPEFREELNDLRKRVEAPGNAAVFAKAGVKFAFQSGDMANPRDFIRNVGRAVEAGLDRDTALRAMTLTAAEILGVAERFGSIEKNKTANLVLATGDLFNSATRVKMVFVDGRKFEIPEQEAPLAAPGAAEAAGVSATGTWTLNVDTPQGALVVTATLQQSGTTVTGTVASPMGTSDITDGRIDGNQLTFRISAGGMEVGVAGTIQGTSIAGSMTAGAMGTMSFTDTRSPREQ